MGMQGACTDRQSTLPSWRLRAGAAGGNPEESSCPEEGSSHGQKEQRQRTGQPNTRGKDRRRRGRNVKEQTEVGSSSNHPPPLGVTIGTTAPNKVPSSTHQEGERRACTKGIWGGAVERSQGIPVLILALFLTSSGLN